MSIEQGSRRHGVQLVQVIHKEMSDLDPSFRAEEVIVSLTASTLIALLLHMVKSQECHAYGEEVDM